MSQNLANIDPFAYSEDVTHFGPELQIFNIFQLIGFIGSILTLVAARFSSRPRQATWYNFIGSLVVFTMSYLLLFFAGHAYDGKPGLPLCIIQSSLTCAASPLCVACALALILQLFFNITSTLSGHSVGGSRCWRIMLVVAPYAVFIFVVIESTIITLAAPNVQLSSISYCSLENHLPGRITSVLNTILVLPILVLNFLVYLRFRKHRSILRAGNFTSIFIRVSVFVLFVVICGSIGFLFFVIPFLSAETSNTGLIGLDIVLSIVPIGAVVIFGTHKDLLVVWLFWRKAHNDSKFPVNPTENLPAPVPSTVHEADYVIDIKRDNDYIQSSHEP